MVEELRIGTNLIRLEWTQYLVGSWHLQLERGNNFTINWYIFLGIIVRFHILSYIYIYVIYMLPLTTTYLSVATKYSSRLPIIFGAI